MSCPISSDHYVSQNARLIYQHAPLLKQWLNIGRPYVCPFTPTQQHIPSGSRLLDIVGPQPQTETMLGGDGMCFLSSLQDRCRLAPIMMDPTEMSRRCRETDGMSHFS